jgi:hypothetical protein
MYFMLTDATVQILKTISSKLQNSNWTIDRTSCGSAQWNLTIVGGDKIQSQVTCDCTFNSSTVCHVISLYVLVSLYPTFFFRYNKDRDGHVSTNALSGRIKLKQSLMGDFYLEYGTGPIFYEHCISC